MDPQVDANVTVLLRAWKNGDRSAAELLFPMVLGELTRLARRRMARENTGHTLQTGALVNEAYLRLADWENAHWENRAQFFAMCSRVMRQILVDHARARRTQKRGNDACMVPFEDVLSVSDTDGEMILALDSALKRLAEIHPRKSDVIELRFFGGLSIEETAESLNVSRMTVIRDCDFAKAWLKAFLEGDPILDEAPDSEPHGDSKQPTTE